MSPDHDLKVALVAMRAGLITADQLAEAGRTWADRPGSCLTDLLVDRGWLSAGQRTEIETDLSREQALPPGAPGSVLTTAIEPDRARDPGDGRGGPSDETRDWSSERESGGPRERPPIDPADHRYSLIRLHATGGLGQVWLAYDRLLGREVAMKRVRPDRSTSLARFLEEARVNGRLEHPNIVPVYDLIGSSSTGSSAYTMRFVRGRTLDQAVAAYHSKRVRGEATPIELRALLDAFVSVCLAAAYAHSKGVLHRDLKGQNVILGDFGEVFLLDWGLAKELDRQEEDEDSVEAPAAEDPQAPDRGLTRPGEVLGTPPYMAPEQASGEAADERSDIYGLGAILYLILTSRAPYIGNSSREILKRVREESPARPRALMPGLPPALEAICCKAMDRDRASRYGSALELAGEVRRWLADEPVEAYPEPWADRLRRWAKRNRPLVASAAVLLASGTIALALSNLAIRAEQRRTEQARGQAEANLNLARKTVDQILLQVAQEAMPNVPGADRLRRRVAEEAATLYGTFLRSMPGNATVQLDGAKALREVGSIRRLSHDFGGAMEAYDRAIGLLEGLLGASPHAVSYKGLLAEVLIEAAVVRDMEGREPEEEPYLLRAIEVAGSIPTSASGATQPDRILSRAFSMRSGVLRETGRPGEAIELGRRAIAALPATDYGALGFFDRLFASSTLSPALLAIGRIDEAEAAARTHLGRTRAFLDEIPENNDRRFQHALALNDLAECLAARPESRDESEATYGEAITLIGPLTEEFSSLPMYRLALARTRINRGLVRLEAGRADQAAEDAQAARILLDLLLETSPDLATYRAEQGRALGLLGRLTIDRGEAEEARRLLDEAIDHTRAALRANPDSPRHRQAIRRIESDRSRIGSGSGPVEPAGDA